MARSISEWIGKSDDHRAPARVRQRVFDSARGICHLCQLQIQTGQKWDLDHDKRAADIWREIDRKYSLWLEGFDVELGLCDLRGYRA